ncbi:MAG: hypothetical protein WDO19_07165 [Bacteroidota bacterium]
MSFAEYEKLLGDIEQLKDESKVKNYSGVSSLFLSDSLQKKELKTGIFTGPLKRNSSCLLTWNVKGLY